jgi:hypothetical protein
VELDFRDIFQFVGKENTMCKTCGCRSGKKKAKAKKKKKKVKKK